MRTGNILFSAVHFLIVLFVMAVGVFFIGISHYANLKAALVDFISLRSHLFFPIGLLVLVAGFLLLMGLYAMQKRVFYRVQMAAHTASVDIPLLHQIIENYWKGVVSQEKKIEEVILYPNQKLEVIAQLPDMNFESQEKLLSQVEKELGELLFRHLGYKQEFFFTIVMK
jgi:hypothetical protein